MNLTTATIICLLLVASQAAIAAVKLPAIIGDNMVLQQRMENPIWGTADPGEKITVSIGVRKVSTVADDKGNWSVKLKPMKAGGPYEMTVAGGNTITLKNILVGEVWVCSGQSNMQMEIKDVLNGKDEVAAASNPNLRLFTVPMKVSVKPLRDCEGTWGESSPALAEHFSATAYFFGRELQKKLNVPVGLIHTSWGGTPAESWTPHEVLSGDPDFVPILTRWQETLKNYPTAKVEYEKAFAKWKVDNEKAKAEGKPETWAPWPPNGPGSPITPAGLYNAMISPVIPFGIKGAIWYQGESNADRAYQYRKLFPAMIESWRQAWKQGEFPFLFVQLANWTGWFPPENTEWAELREAQTLTLRHKNTGMAVAIDIGDAADIHPKNKQDVGKRLELAAEAIAYGKQIEYSGPMYESMKIDGDRVILRFSHAAGLTAKGDDLKGFTIAGEDKKFVPASAKISGDTVIVRADDVAKPAAVRYAWQSNPACNLYNKAGLPASPFRTDDWPGATAERK